MDNASKARYEDDGYLFPLPIVSGAEALEYRRRIEADEAKHADRLPVSNYLRFDPHYLLPAVHELVRHPRILDVAETILGPDLMVSNTNLFLKDPHTRDHVTWHQDLHYVGLDGDAFITVWLAPTRAFSPEDVARYEEIREHRRQFLYQGAGRTGE